MKINKTRRKGFTILELIVVMAIIAILTLIAVPTYNKFINNAVEVKNEANVNLVIKAIIIFQTEHPDFETNYGDYTTQEDYGEWMGLTYIKPGYIQPYINGEVVITDDEMHNMQNGDIRIEYSAVNNKKDYNFEIQVAGSNHNRAPGKEYGRYYYDPK